MKWVRIEKNEDIPVDKQIALGLFVKVLGLKEKIFQIEIGYLDDEYNFLDSYGDYITGWDLEDYTHYCIMPELPNENK